MCRGRALGIARVARPPKLDGTFAQYSPCGHRTRRGVGVADEDYEAFVRYVFEQEIEPHLAEVHRWRQ